MVKKRSREFEIPGPLEHIFKSFEVIFKNWKVFLPLLLIAVVLSLILVGVQINYSEITITFSVLIFLMVWLVTIFVVRQYFAGRKVKLREGLYNSMGPLLSTLVVFLVAAVESIPIVLLVIAYSAAVETGFLKLPFYALLFFGFAALMILLSSYLFSSSLMALVAVSAPGLYPREALKSAADLVVGRRTKVIFRVVTLIIAMGIMWAVVMLPLIGIDTFFKQFSFAAEIPFIAICLTILTCFTEIYVTVYLYIYYRYLLGRE